MVTDLLDLDHSWANANLVDQFLGKVDLKVQNNIGNVIKLWDNFIYMIFEFKLYAISTQILDSVFSQFRNFCIQYIQILNDKILKYPHNVQSELTIIDDNIELLCLRMQQYKELLGYVFKYRDQSMTEDVRLSQIRSIDGLSDHRSLIQNIGIPKSVFKLCTETYIYALQFRINTLSKNKTFVWLQNMQNIWMSLLSQNWKSYKLPETSIQFTFTGIRGSTGYQTYKLASEDIEEDEAINTLYVADEFWRMLKSNIATMLPGFEGEHNHSTKVLTQKKSKQLIPSYELFSFRKELWKMSPKITSSVAQHVSWCYFAKDMIEMTSQIVATYINIWFYGDNDDKVNQSESILVDHVDFLENMNFSLSKSRRLNILIDIRYLNMLIVNYLWVLLTELWKFEHSYVSKTLFWSIQTLKSYQAILTSIELSLSVTSKSEMTSYQNLLKEISEFEKNRSGQMPEIVKKTNHQKMMRQVDQKYSEIKDIARRFPILTQEICLKVLTGKWDSLVADKDKNDEWIAEINSFLIHKPHPQEFVLNVPKLTKYEEVKHKSKIKNVEVVIHHTILKFTDSLLNNFRPSENDIFSHQQLCKRVIWLFRSWTHRGGDTSFPDNTLSKRSTENNKIINFIG